MCGKGMCMCVNVSVYVYVHNYMHVCICMYICAVELLSGAKFGLFKCHYLGQVCFFLTMFVKNAISMGFSFKSARTISGPNWCFWTPTWPR